MYNKVFGVQILIFYSDSLKSFLFCFLFFLLLFYFLYNLKGESYYPARQRYYYDIFLGAGCSNNPCGTNAVCREASGGRPGCLMLFESFFLQL